MKIISQFKPLSICILLFSCYVITFAQEPQSVNDISWSKNFKPKINYNNQLDILGIDENNVWFSDKPADDKPLKPTTFKYNENIVKYDRLTNNLTYLPLKLKSNGEKRNRIDLKCRDGKINVMSYSVDKKASVFRIFQETANMKTMTFDNNLQLIASINYDKTQVKDIDNIYIEISRVNIADDLLTIKYVYSTKTGNVNGYLLYDNQYKQLSRFENSTSSSSVVMNYAFDKQSNLYTLERDYWGETNDIYEGYAENALGKSTLTYYPKDGSPSVKKELAMDLNMAGESTIAVNDKNELVCVGGYSVIGRRKIVGVYSAIFRPRLEGTCTTHFVEFGYDLLSEGMTKKKAKELKDDLMIGKDNSFEDALKFKNVHFNSQGGFSAVAEKRFVNYKNKNTSYYAGVGNFHGSSVLVTQFGFHDIFVLSFNEDGSSKWIQKIYRNELFDNSHSNNYFLGNCYLNFSKDDGLTILHNQFNVSNEDIDSQPSFKNGKTLKTTIKPDGTLSTKEFISDSSIARKFCPGFTYKNMDNQLYLIKSNYLVSNALIEIPSVSFNIGVTTAEPF
ncbi:MAG: hypothetical protein PHV20_13625 [Bacteroidales bacterium]|nr:hypothetical protein [Bacteroidales bacterium]